MINQEIKQARIAIFLILLFSLATYSVFFTTLTLFTTNGLKLNDVTSAGITATFFVFHFVLQIVGGFFTGRFFSHRFLIIFGFLLQALGCFYLSFYKLSWGLAFFLIGDGFNLVCINCVITQFFAANDKKRESAFLYNYVAMNVGALIGSTISGFFEIGQFYHLLFTFAAISNLVPVIIVFLKWNLLKDRGTIYLTRRKNQKLAFIILGSIYIIISIFAMKWIIDHYLVTNDITFFMGIIMVLFIAFLAIKEKSKLVQKKIWAFLIFLLASIIFGILFLMTPIGLVLFLENNVQRNIFNFIIPPQWAINFITFSLIISGPIFATLFRKMRNRGYRITITTQFIYSLSCITIGFVILLLGIVLSDAKGYVNFIYIIISFIFLGVGEILFSPIGYAMIGEIIPQKLHGIMMGLWFLANGVAASISNKFSQMAIGSSKSTNPLTTNPHFFKSFLYLAFISFVGVVFLCLLSKILNKWTKVSDS